MNATAEFLSEEECKEVFDRIVALGSGGGDTHVSILSRYTAGITWNRNRLYLARAIRGLEISITRSIRGAAATVVTSVLDSASLTKALRRAETALTLAPESLELKDDSPLNEPVLSPILWSDSTYAFNGAKRGEFARAMIASAEDAGLLAGGELLISGQGHAVLNTEGMHRYHPVTTVECSMTVRDSKGTASGWAGKTHYTMDSIDGKAIATTAVDKCTRSVNPTAIEPGRYTAILEPQAVADLLGMLISRDNRSMSRIGAERGRNVFTLRTGRSKIGSQVLDRRLSIKSDPIDPEAGFIPFTQDGGEPYRPITWIKNGYLRELWYPRNYALGVLNKPHSLLMQGSYQLAGNTTPVSIEEMIATTQRGILVTRLSSVWVVEPGSVLSTGFTRDGLWLIENGRITKPIKNFRFAESPVFILNKVESVGEPVRVFNKEYAQVVAAIKVRDFSFTSLADAV